MGERPIKSFFEKYKNKKENKPILGLKNSSGVEVNDQGMIRIVEEYYTNLFKPKETNQSVVNLFLNNIQAVECEDLMRNLIKPFSMQEIWDAVISFKSDKAPGPDGISVEFYKECFQVIKYDLRKVLNLFLNKGRLPAKYKAGLITLIPKKEPYNEVGNFRPISLLNTDYKIFTKIITNRLNPVLEHIIHESQFAQPGRDIQEMNTLIRDLIADIF